MTRRVLGFTILALSVAAAAAAQNGQGASARPDATPPTRPSTLTPAGRVEPGPFVPVNGGRPQNLLLVFPVIQPPLIGMGQGHGAPPEPVYQPGNGITPPTLTKTVDPEYTERAKTAKIQGEVWLDTIVEKDGSVTIRKVAKSLDPELDQKAIEAAKQWTFKPGERNGQPVRVQTQMILEFRLSKRTDASFERIDEFLNGVHKGGEAGLVQPRPIVHPDASYTAQALRRKLEGTVQIEVVVGPDGNVARARVTQSLDKVYGLDDNALATAKSWTFEPGTLNGQPVSVLVTLTMAFRLH
jgi:TonB family protein